MADQKKINENGSSETSFIHNLSEFASDVVSLCELQARLFLVDGQEVAQKVFAPLAVLLMGGAVLAGCIPIALAGFALLLAENTSLTLAQSFLMVVGIGFLIGIGVVCYAWNSLIRETSFFSRSLRECDANTRWIKGVLSRLAKMPPVQDHPQGSSRISF